MLGSLYNVLDNYGLEIKVYDIFEKKYIYIIIV